MKKIYNENINNMWKWNNEVIEVSVINIEMAARKWKAKLMKCRKWNRSGNENQAETEMKMK